MVELRCSDEPARAAASLLCAELAASHGESRLAIAGGSVLDVLAGPAFDAHWQRLRVTWVDERLVPVADASSNRGAALSRTNIAKAAHSLPLVLDEELTAPQRALSRVERELSRGFRGGLDLTLLGLGEDGHIASLFPGRPFGDGARLAMLVDDSPKPPPRRISLTLAMLATARRHVVYAVGAGKREAIARLLAGDPALPASSLTGMVVVTDPAGAG